MNEMPGVAGWVEAMRQTVRSATEALKVRSGALLLLLLMAGSTLQAQESPAPYPAPVGKFDRDTALLASPVRYTLTVHRTAGTQVLFPDSVYDYAPFELRSRVWYPTRVLADSTLVDSAVYELMSFSGQPELALALPVFYLTGVGDSLPVFPDDALLHQRLASKTEAVADTLEPAIQTLTVKERFNYPYWIIGISLVVGFLAVANLFLGKPLQRYFRIWVEGRRHRAFIRSYDRLVQQVRQRGSSGPLERALNLWKAYIERVENIPYTTYTTKDFAEHLPDPALTKSLQELDRYIYGGFPPEEAETAYAVLRRMAIRIYAQKAQQLRHG